MGSEAFRLQTGSCLECDAPLFDIGLYSVIWTVLELFVNGCYPEWRVIGGWLQFMGTKIKCRSYEKYFPI
jgi:hypothetical protein